MKVIYSFLHVVEADGSIQLRTDTQVYLDCDDESKHDIIINTYVARIIIIMSERARGGAADGATDEGALIIIIITMDGRRCSSKFIAYGMQESK